jgi:preprotein translocase SecF subunit
VFHLTRYKYWFFGISGLVILPGLLALIFWHLNPGIDFTGGSIVEMRFADKNIGTTEIGNEFASVGATDVHVLAASGLAGAPTANQYVYITLSRPIDNDEVTAIANKLKDPKAGLPDFNKVEGKYYVVTPPNGGNDTALVVASFAKPVSADAVKAALKDLPATGAPPVTEGQSSATPTPASQGGNGTTFPVSVSSVTVGSNELTYSMETQKFLDVDNVNKAVFALQHKYGPAYTVTQDKVGASIGQETTQNAVIAVAIASLFIMLYIAFAFRHVGSTAQAFRFGASAIIALLHDVLVVLGLWAIFGHFFNFKVDSLFLTAVLTVIGFSVHDTIVVFDRIRENMRRRTSESFEQITDASLIQTMTRSLNTSLTVLLTLSALTLFGGASIREFTLALLIGILSGTYSSIFNASMLLVVWETGEWRSWFHRGPKAAEATSRRQLAGTRA